MIAALIALSGAARAAEDTADEAKKAAVLEEARQHVAKAKVHYDLGEFNEAADEYILVYRLRPIPALLFNIAQAYRQAGSYEKAKQFYKSYLRESPEAKNRAMIEQAIHEMDELLAKEKRTKEKPPNGVKEPPDTSLPLERVAKVPAERAKPAEVAAKPPEQKPVEQKPAAVAQTPPQQKPAQAAPAVAAPATPPQPAKPPVVAMATPRATAPPAATTSTRAPVVEEDDPIYKKWWFWTAIGVVAVGGGAAAMTMGGNSAPGSHFGTTPVFP